MSASGDVRISDGNAKFQVDFIQTFLMHKMIAIILIMHLQCIHNSVYQIASTYPMSSDTLSPGIISG